MCYATHSSKTSENIGSGSDIVKNKYYELWNIVLKRNARVYTNTHNLTQKLKSFFGFSFDLIL